MVEWMDDGQVRFLGCHVHSSTAKYLVATRAMTGEGVAGCKTGHMLNSRELGRTGRHALGLGLRQFSFPSPMTISIHSRHTTAAAATTA